MRGTLPHAAGDGANSGIIPADAGNTRAVPDPDVSLEDHPRGCGEHESIINLGVALQGSSPRMRGTLVAAAVVAKHRRIIPADAGNTEAIC